jgi:hypothetical protein
VPSYDVVLDAVSTPEQLTLNTTCKRVRLKQKNADDTTLLAFRVYEPTLLNDAEYVPAGGEWVREFQKMTSAGTRFALAETVSSTATFSQVEE